MRNKSKIKIIILVLGIVFTLSTINSFRIINDQGETERTIENRDDSNLKALRISGYWTTNFIHIDGNWSHTVGNYSWCSGDGSWGNPYIIENVTIDASTSPTGSGIFIDNSKNDYFIINNVTVYNSGTGFFDAGIKLENTSNGTLINNNCFDNQYTGLFLSQNCNNNTLSGNTASNIGTSKQSKGICLNDDCDNNIITGNTADNNTDGGMMIQNDCDNNIISGNIANNNDDYGIVLELGCDNNTISRNTASNIGTSNQDYGIFLVDDCNNNTISGNAVNNNILFGIILSEGNNVNTISGNTVNNNSLYGIYLTWDSRNNTISENLVFENNDGIRLLENSFDNLLFYNYIFNNSNCNGFDSEYNNWDNGVIGNYWGNYSGIDADHDGIGDTPYNVAGGAGNKDNKPIMNYDPFFFKSPDDLIYEVGTGEYNVEWVVITTSLFPSTFNVFRDGTSVKTGKLVTFVNEIVINVDGLDSGIYGFTIEVNDGSGGTYTDGVWVTVINTNPVFTATPSDFSYEVGSTGNNLSWAFSDVSTNNPTYKITRNCVPIIIDNPCVSGQVIEISVDGLDVGSHGFTIEIDDGYGGTVLDSVWITIISSSDSNLIDLLYVEIVDQSFSLEEFNITFSVYNESGQGIDSATIQLWWNGVDVSDDVINLGNELYYVSLDPITVAPGEDPILLKMVISASGYEDKQFETYLAVDPETLEKGAEKDGDEFPIMILIIAIVSAVGGIGATIITIGILRKRKPTKEVI